MFQRTFIAISAVLLFAATAVAGPHYTVRLRDQHEYNGPDVKKIVFSPDSSQVAIATSRGLYLVRTRDAEMVGKKRYSGFSMAYSKDGSRLYMIGYNVTVRQSAFLTYGLSWVVGKFNPGRNSDVEVERHGGWAVEAG